MQSVLSRIWTRVIVSISYDDNHYTTGTSTYTTGTSTSWFIQCQSYSWWSKVTALLFILLISESESRIISVGRCSVQSKQRRLNSTGFHNTDLHKNHVKKPSWIWRQNKMSNYWHGLTSSLKRSGLVFWNLRSIDMNIDSC